ncbi:MAG: hypothetical protein GY822_24255, partial [Deltaproteobacteria bacterium]|nr:hypothetical protein [Deltaproteobacteria bacterium]
MQPSHFYQWREVLLDNLEAAMEKGNKRRRRAVDDKSVTLTKKVEALQGRLATKDAIIADISEEHFKLKVTVAMGCCAFSFRAIAAKIFFLATSIPTTIALPLSSSCR